MMIAARGVGLTVGGTDNVMPIGMATVYVWCVLRICWGGSRRMGDGTTLFA
tara:strand:+ start:216 stop:368 length:153 start_codon:yes stop_codon:yes gene_type:complete